MNGFFDSYGEPQREEARRRRKERQFPLPFADRLRSSERAGKLPMSFRFLRPGKLTDGEIVLKLIETLEADEEKGYLPSYYFHIYVKKSRTPVGRCDLRIGHNICSYYGGNIGYRVFEPFRGHRYAAKACFLLFTLARRHRMSELCITCNPDNLPSRRTCEIVGGMLKEVVDLPPDNEMYLEGERQKCRFIIQL